MRNYGVLVGLVLLGSAIPALAEDACTYAHGKAYGKAVAEEQTRLAWGGAGACYGLLCNAPGCLFAAGHAYWGTTTQSAPPVSECMNSQAFITGYRKGYAEEAKPRNAVSALVGGAIGTALQIPIIWLIFF